MGGPNSEIFVNTKMTINSIAYGLRLNYSIKQESLTPPAAIEPPEENASDDLIYEIRHFRIIIPWDNISRFICFWIPSLFKT
jgi:hypothetical protein